MNPYLILTRDAHLQVPSFHANLRLFPGLYWKTHSRRQTPQNVTIMLFLTYHDKVRFSNQTNFISQVGDAIALNYLYYNDKHLNMHYAAYPRFYFVREWFDTKRAIFQANYHGAEEQRLVLWWYNIQAAYNKIMSFLGNAIGDLETMGLRHGNLINGTVVMVDDHF